MRSAALLAAVTLLALAPPAYAQRFPFERTYEVPSPVVLDVTTVRGRIDVVAAETSGITVAGEATVRVGWNVPANAVDLARRVAESPPIEQSGTTLRLRPPSDGDSQRAVTVSYRVQVPKGTRVVTRSESGATSVSGVHGPIDVRTQSGAIDLGRLGGDVTVESGSGAVALDGAAGAVRITTASGSVTAHGVGGALGVHTSSGAVEAAMSGPGDVDVETGSSGIEVSGATGGLKLTTSSGRLNVRGRPGSAWTLSSGSGGVVVELAEGAAFRLDASSRSGSVSLDGAAVSGQSSKGKVEGTVAGGGPLLRVTTRSGSIRVRVGG